MIKNGKIKKMFKNFIMQSLQEFSDEYFKLIENLEKYIKKAKKDLEKMVAKYSI